MDEITKPMQEPADMQTNAGKALADLRSDITGTANEKENPIQSGLTVTDYDIPNLPNSVDLGTLFQNYSDVGAQKLTAPLIQQWLTAANSGDSQQQMMFFRSILERDGLIQALFNTRALAVAGCSSSVICKENEAKAEEIREELETAGLEDLKRHLLTAIPYGIAGARIIWSTSGRFGIAGFEPIHPVNIKNTQNGGIIITDLNNTSYAITTENAHHFIFHKNVGGFGLPVTQGVLRTVAFLYFLKSTCLRYQFRFLERHGLPTLIAQISKADFMNNDIRNKMLQALSVISQESIALTTNEAKIEVANVAASQSSNSDFLKVLTFLNEELTKLIVGQLASSGDTGGFSKGQMQENVRQDIRAADASALSATLTNQLIRPLERMKYGTSTCRYSIDAKPPGDIVQVANAVKALKEIDRKPPDSWLEDTFKFTVESISGNMGMAPSLSQIPPSTGTSLGAMPSAVPESAPLATPALPDNATIDPTQGLTPMSDLTDNRRGILLAFNSVSIDIRNKVNAVLGTVPYAGSLTSASPEEVPTLLYDIAGELENTSETADPASGEMRVSFRGDSLTPAERTNTVSEIKAAAEQIAQILSENREVLNKVKSDVVSMLEPEKDTERPSTLSNIADLYKYQVGAKADLGSREIKEDFGGTIDLNPLKSMSELDRTRLADSAKAVNELKNKPEELEQAKLIQLDIDQLEAERSAKVANVSDRERAEIEASYNQAIKELKDKPEYKPMQDLSDYQRIIVESNLGEKLNDSIEGILRSTGTNMNLFKGSIERLYNNTPGAEVILGDKDKFIKQAQIEALKKKDFYTFTGEIYKSKSWLGQTMEDLSASWSRGAQSFVIDTAGVLNMALGNSDYFGVNEFVKNSNKYLELERANSEVGKAHSIASSILYSFTEMLPSMVPAVLTAGAGAGLKAASAAGKLAQLGAVGTNLGKAGTAIWMVQGSGQAYNDMLAAGVDSKVAIPIALAAGYLYGSVEKLQFSGFKSGFAESFRKVADQNIKNIISKYTAKYGAEGFTKIMAARMNPVLTASKSILAEVGEEVLQDVIMTNADAAARLINDAAFGGNLTAEGKTALEQIEQYKETAIQSLGPIALMHGSFKAAGYGAGKLANKLGTPTDNKPTGVPYTARPGDENLSTDELTKRAHAELLDAIKELKANPTAKSNVVESLAKLIPPSDKPYPVRSMTPASQDVVKAVGTVSADMANAVNDYASKHAEFAKALEQNLVKLSFEHPADSAQAALIEGTIGASLTMPTADTPYYQIHIDGTQVTDPEVIKGLLIHEDFGHRFIPAILGEDALNDLFDMLRPLADAANSPFWSDSLDATYRLYYREQAEALNIPADQIDAFLAAALDSEKLTAFLGSERFKNLKPASAIGQIINKIVYWLRQHFPRVFSGMNDKAAYAWLQNLYTVYSKGTRTVTKAPASVQTPSVMPQIKVAKQTNVAPSTALDIARRRAQLAEAVTNPNAVSQVTPEVSTTYEYADGQATRAEAEVQDITAPVSSAPVVSKLKEAVVLDSRRIDLLDTLQQTAASRARSIESKYKSTFTMNLDGRALAVRPADLRSNNLLKALSNIGKVQITGARLAELLHKAENLDIDFTALKAMRTQIQSDIDSNPEATGVEQKRAAIDVIDLALYKAMHLTPTEAYSVITVNSPIAEAWFSLPALQNFVKDNIKPITKQVRFEGKLKNTEVYPIAYTRASSVEELREALRDYYNKNAGKYELPADVAAFIGAKHVVSLEDVMAHELEAMRFDYAEAMSELSDVQSELGAVADPKKERMLLRRETELTSRIMEYEQALAEGVVDTGVIEEVADAIQAGRLIQDMNQRIDSEQSFTRVALRVMSSVFPEIKTTNDFKKIPVTQYARYNAALQDVALFDPATKKLYGVGHTPSVADGKVANNPDESLALLEVARHTDDPAIKKIVKAYDALDSVKFPVPSEFKGLGALEFVPTERLENDSDISYQIKKAENYLLEITRAATASELLTPALAALEQKTGHGEDRQAAIEHGARFLRNMVLDYIHILHTELSYRQHERGLGVIKAIIEQDQSYAALHPTLTEAYNKTMAVLANKADRRTIEAELVSVLNSSATFDNKAAAYAAYISRYNDLIQAKVSIAPTADVSAVIDTLSAYKPEDRRNLSSLSALRERAMFKILDPSITEIIREYREERSTVDTAYGVDDLIRRQYGVIRHLVTVLNTKFKQELDTNKAFALIDGQIAAHNKLYTLMTGKDKNVKMTPNAIPEQLTEIFSTIAKSPENVKQLTDDFVQLWRSSTDMTPMAYQCHQTIPELLDEKINMLLGVANAMFDSFEVAALEDTPEAVPGAYMANKKALYEAILDPDFELESKYMDVLTSSKFSLDMVGHREEDRADAAVQIAATLAERLTLDMSDTRDLLRYNALSVDFIQKMIENLSLISPEAKRQFMSKFEGYVKGIERYMTPTIEEANKRMTDLAEAVATDSYDPTFISGVYAVSSDLTRLQTQIALRIGLNEKTIELLVTADAGIRKRLRSSKRVTTPMGAVGVSDEFAALVADLTAVDVYEPATNLVKTDFGLFDMNDLYTRTHIGKSGVSVDLDDSTDEIDEAKVAKFAEELGVLRQDVATYRELIDSADSLPYAHARLTAFGGKLAEQVSNILKIENEADRSAALKALDIPPATVAAIFEGGARARFDRRVPKEGKASLISQAAAYIDSSLRFQAGMVGRLRTVTDTDTWEDSEASKKLAAEFARFNQYSSKASVDDGDSMLIAERIVAMTQDDQLNLDRFKRARVDYVKNLKKLIDAVHTSKADDLKELQVQYNKELLLLSDLTTNSAVVAVDENAKQNRAVIASRVALVKTLDDFKVNLAYKLNNIVILDSVLRLERIATQALALNTGSDAVNPDGRDQEIAYGSSTIDNTTASNVAAAASRTASRGFAMVEEQTVGKVPSAIDIRDSIAFGKALEASDISTDALRELAANAHGFAESAFKLKRSIGVPDYADTQADKIYFGYYTNMMSSPTVPGKFRNDVNWQIRERDEILKLKDVSGKDEGDLSAVQRGNLNGVDKKLRALYANAVADAAAICYSIQNDINKMNVDDSIVGNRFLSLAKPVFGDDLVPEDLGQYLPSSYMIRALPDNLRKYRKELTQATAHNIKDVITRIYNSSASLFPEFRTELDSSEFSEVLKGKLSINNVQASRAYGKRILDQIESIAARVGIPTTGTAISDADLKLIRSRIAMMRNGALNIDLKKHLNINSNDKAEQQLYHIVDRASDAMVENTFRTLRDQLTFTDSETKEALPHMGGPLLTRDLLKAMLDRYVRTINVLKRTTVDPEVLKGKILNVQTLLANIPLGSTQRAHLEKYLADLTASPIGYVFSLPENTIKRDPLLNALYNVIMVKTDESPDDDPTPPSGGDDSGLKSYSDVEELTTPIGQKKNYGGATLYSIRTLTPEQMNERLQVNISASCSDIFPTLGRFDGYKFSQLLALALNPMPSPATGLKDIASARSSIISTYERGVNSLTRLEAYEKALTTHTSFLSQILPTKNSRQYDAIEEARKHIVAASKNLRDLINSSKLSKTEVVFRVNGIIRSTDERLRAAFNVENSDPAVRINGLLTQANAIIKRAAMNPKYYASKKDTVLRLMELASDITLLTPETVESSITELAAKTDPESEAMRVKLNSIKSAVGSKSINIENLLNNGKTSEVHKISDELATLLGSINSVIPPAPILAPEIVKELNPEQKAGKVFNSDSTFERMCADASMFITGLVERPVEFMSRLVGYIPNSKLLSDVISPLERAVREQPAKLAVYLTEYTRINKAIIAPAGLDNPSFTIDLTTTIGEERHQVSMDQLLAIYMYSRDASNVDALYKRGITAKTLKQVDAIIPQRFKDMVDAQIAQIKADIMPELSRTSEAVYGLPIALENDLQVFKLDKKPEETFVDVLYRDVKSTMDKSPVLRSYIARLQGIKGTALTEAERDLTSLSYSGMMTGFMHDAAAYNTIRPKVEAARQIFSDPDVEEALRIQNKNLPKYMDTWLSGMESGVYVSDNAVSRHLRTAAVTYGFAYNLQLVLQQPGSYFTGLTAVASKYGIYTALKHAIKSSVPSWTPRTDAMRYRQMSVDREILTNLRADLPTLTRGMNLKNVGAKLGKVYGDFKGAATSIKEGRKAFNAFVAGIKPAEMEAAITNLTNTLGPDMGLNSVQQASLARNAATYFKTASSDLYDAICYMGMWMMTQADQITASAVHEMAYQSALESGKTEQQALNEADDIVYRTQSYGDKRFLPQQWSTPVVALFTIFKTQQSMITNQALEEAGTAVSSVFGQRRKLLEEEQINPTIDGLKHAALAMFSIASAGSWQYVFKYGIYMFLWRMMSNSIESLFSEGGDDEEKELSQLVWFKSSDLIDALSGTLVGGIPVAGDIVTAAGVDLADRLDAQYGWKRNIAFRDRLTKLDIPTWRPVLNAVSALTEEDPEKARRGLISSGLLLAKLPAGAMMKIFNNLDAVRATNDRRAYIHGAWNLHYQDIYPVSMAVGAPCGIADNIVNYSNFHGDKRLTFKPVSPIVKCDEATKLIHQYNLAYGTRYTLSDLVQNWTTTDSGVKLDEDTYNKQRISVSDNFRDSLQRLVTVLPAYEDISIERANYISGQIYELYNKALADVGDNEQVALDVYKEVYSKLKNMR